MKDGIYLNNDEGYEVFHDDEQTFPNDEGYSEACWSIYRDSFQDFKS